MNTLWKNYKLKVLSNDYHKYKGRNSGLWNLKIASYFIMMKSAANVQLLPNCLQLQ